MNTQKGAIWADRASWHCQKPENKNKPECDPTLTTKKSGWKNDDGTSTVNTTNPEKQLGLPKVKADLPSSYWGMIGGLGGALYGLLFAYNRKSGFWGYVGWWLLFGTIGSLGGKIVDATISKVSE